MALDLCEPYFDPSEFLRKRRALKRELATEGLGIPLRIALLGGSTTHEIRLNLEIFLLDAGIAPEFYESDYNKYQEEVLYDDRRLVEFAPAVVYFHTTVRNLTAFPVAFATEDKVEKYVEAEIERFVRLWDKVRSSCSATIIQNNFEFPAERPLGNRDAVEHFGRIGIISRINAGLAQAVRTRTSVLLHDINYLSARVGLEQWSGKDYWYRYKLAVSPTATVMMARSLAALVRALVIGSKKCLVLDLDNTLWGGVIGDDSMQGIKLGADHTLGEAYRDFQSYVKRLRERGILLAVCSKNDPAVAREGLSHPDSVLAVSDFAAFYANWEPKPDNLRGIARDLNIGLEALVFVDDNPVERAAVRSALPMVAVPDVGNEVSQFAQIIEAGGYFEPVFLAADDQQRNAYYQANEQRQATLAAFSSNDEFLASLEMSAEIAAFRPLYLERITQLINKTNQFNLTTRRYSPAEVEAAAKNERQVTLYGRLRDKFGDNGLVSVIIGSCVDDRLIIDLWLMSCRVLKRGMEYAMLDVLAREARGRGLRGLEGAYSPTPKNGMVADHYRELGFNLLSSEANGRTTWWLDLSSPPVTPKHHIRMEAYG